MVPRLADTYGAVWSDPDAGKNGEIGMWWYRYLGVEDQTPAEKRAMSNGVNLFFGALIGANLGTLDGMTLSDYTLIIAVVCLIVMYIQLAPVARKRWTYLGILGGAYGTAVCSIDRSARRSVVSRQNTTASALVRDDLLLARFRSLHRVATFGQAASRRR
jgi:hypothetical protein